MIEVQNLHKEFGSVTAVNDISFAAKRGEIFALLGPNGAGKTTTLRMMYGLIKPTRGDVLMDGRSIVKHTLALQNNIGALPDGGSLYTRLTAKENIEYFARLNHVGKQDLKIRLDDLCQRLNFGNILNRRTQGFSQGERMKIALARALIHNPDFIFLDEPTNGLDVLTTRAVRALLRDLREQDKCVIFSSHLMNEVHHLCDQVAIVSHAEIAIHGSVNNVISRAKGNDLEEAFIEFAYPELLELNKDSTLDSATADVPQNNKTNGEAH